MRQVMVAKVCQWSWAEGPRGVGTSNTSPFVPTLLILLNSCLLVQVSKLAFLNLNNPFTRVAYDQAYEMFTLQFITVAKLKL